jgi:CRISPR/Cas system CSM-associated protein Csm5 (group 7 of RAMP superfamily)
VCSSDLLLREYDLLENDVKSEAYRNELEKIMDLCDGSPKDIACLRVGFGKGYFANSIGDALFAYIENLEDEEAKEKMENTFEEYLKSIFKKGGQPIADFDMYKFPRTHLHTTRQQKPLGWIKIEKV